ncbi:MAG: hypothetical protein E7324_04025 [Clostridiales bacterium]|nr:hypothetical protein [Clostridiales bacterium]
MEHDGHRERLRLRYMEQGLRGFAPHEVLELLLTYAIPRVNTNPIAHELLSRFGSLHGVMEADPRELMQVRGIGAQAATLLTMLPQVFKMYQQDVLKPLPRLDTYDKLARYCRTLFVGAVDEAAYVLCFDGQLKLLAAQMIAVGTPSEVSVIPRQVVQCLMRHHAVSVALTHNHPSGSLVPSQEDVDLTASVSQVLRGMDIRLIDHVLVAGEETFSFHLNGYLGEEVMPPADDGLLFAADRPQRKLPPRRR